MARPRISNSSAPGSLSNAAVSSGATRTISPPCPLAATAMLPPTRNASPPNIFFSTTGCLPSAARNRSARSSSYAMRGTVRRSAREAGVPWAGGLRQRDRVAEPLSSRVRQERQCRLEVRIILRPAQVRLVQQDNLRRQVRHVGGHQHGLLHRHPNPRVLLVDPLPLLDRLQQQVEHPGRLRVPPHPQLLVLRR